MEIFFASAQLLLSLFTLAETVFFKILNCMAVDGY